MKKTQTYGKNIFFLKGKENNWRKRLTAQLSHRKFKGAAVSAIGLDDRQANAEYQWCYNQFIYYY